MERFDTVLQDAKTLLKAAKSHAAYDDKPGIGAALIDDLAGAIERAAASDLTQRNAIRETGRLTAAQDKAMKEGLDQIRKIRFAGKACYKKEDTQTLKGFQVGKQPPTTVKAALGDLSYLRDVAHKYLGDLKDAGFGAAELAAVDAAIQTLETTDVSQEIAKKKQKEATRSRDESYKALQEAARKLRNAAKSVFIGQPGVLVEFESTARSKPSKSGPKLVEKSARPPKSAEA